MNAGRILVAGLSPAWQQILRFTTLIPGEVNRAGESHGCASGKVLNVARACHALGAPTSVITVVGGLTGQAIRQEFQGLDIVSKWVDGGLTTRTCTTLLDQSTGTTTELVENAGPISASTLTQFRAGFQELARDAKIIVFTGSLPAGTPPEFVADLLAPLNVPLILDIRGPELLACLPLKPLLVKPNREELSQTFPDAATDPAKLGVALRRVADAGAQCVLVSDGPQGLDLQWRSTHYRFASPRVDAVNPIGCGDCLAAGIAVATYEGEGMLNAIRLGIGAAAQNATTLLPARIDRETAKRLSDQTHAARSA